MRNIEPILSLIILFILSNCGSGLGGSSSSSTSTNTSPTVKKTIQDPTQPQTLDISTGDLSGTSITLPANSLPKGASVSVAQASQPSSFSKTLSGTTSASPALQIAFSNSSGKAITPTNPATIIIPVTTGSLALASVDQVLANLFALLQGVDGILYYWSHSMFANINTSKKTISLKVTQGGIYQLGYLPEAPANYKSITSTTSSSTTTSSTTTSSSSTTTTSDSETQSDSSTSTTTSSTTTSSTTTSSTTTTSSSEETTNSQINGTYKLHSATCNGSPESGSVANETVIIKDTSGSLKSVSGTCTVSLSLSVAYPNENHATVTYGEHDCPSSCLSQLCSAFDKIVGTSNSVSFSSNSTTITTTNTASECVSGSSKKFTEINTFTEE